MSATVTLEIIGRSEIVRRFVFEERTTILLGRDADCQIRFPRDRAHQSVSRHHCLIDINPPDVRVRDLGSRSGTRVNGRLIGKRDRELSAEEAAEIPFDEHALYDGDEIRLGAIRIKLDIKEPIYCNHCSGEIAPDEKDACKLPNGVYLCIGCRSQPEMDAFASEPKAERCPRCGRSRTADDASGELCEECQSAPEEVARRFLALANRGGPDLAAFRGYQIVTVLGHVDLGSAIQVVHERSEEWRALKLMVPQVPSTKKLRDLFHEQAALMKVLDHPHIVRLYDVARSHGTFFLLQDYCEGGTVGELLKRRGKLPDEMAVRLILQALEGLEYAHRVKLPTVTLPDGTQTAPRGLVHSDIKPQNLFLERIAAKYSAKIGDYGLAKAFDLAGLSGLSMTGTITGAPAFMPRQQLLDHRNPKPEVDVWALAATLYYMLTMQYPREFRKGADPWKAILQTNPVSILERDPSLARRLGNVIDEALIDSPEIRFKSAAEFHAALKEMF